MKQKQHPTPAQRRKALDKLSDMISAAGLDEASSYYTGTKPKLPPPAGFGSWLEYAIRTIDVRSLHLQLGLGGQKQWPKDTSTDDMQKAAKDELSEMQTQAAQAAFEKVRLRSVGIEDEILAEEGGALSVEQFTKALGGVSILDYRRDQRVFGVPRGDKRVYPAWQIYKKKLVPGLSGVLKVLGDTDPLGIATYFLTPAEALDDKRPLDLLRAGKIDKVVAHAKHHVDQR